MSEKQGKDSAVEDKSFIGEIIKQKRFMEHVGPGSYNVGESVIMQPGLKGQQHNEAFETIAATNARIQEIMVLKKYKLKLQQTVGR